MMVVWLILSKHFSISSSMTRLLIPLQMERRLICRIFWASCADLLNSTRLSPTPLVFKTVLETFTSHGSSINWCLSRIPHYPYVLNFLKSFRWALARYFFNRICAITTIVGSFCVVAMSVKELPILILILSTLRFGDNVVNFHYIVFTKEQSAAGAFSLLPFQK